MAREGWHLSALGLPGNYIFKTGAPRKDVYRLDFINNGSDYKNYLQLFADSGWEHIGVMGGWQYFRKQMQGDLIPEIYTDNASKAQKYQRVLIFLVILLPIFIMSITNLGSEETTWFDFFSILKTIFGLFLIFYVYAMLRIFRRILQLTKK